MHLAYSSLRSSNEREKISNPKPVKKKEHLRYIGYLAACRKYQDEIAAIQEYLPNWKPAFH